MDFFFGDSMTMGGNTDAATAAFWSTVVVPWPKLVTPGGTIKALSGNTVGQQASVVFAYTPTSPNRHFYLAGKADLGIYGAGSGALQQFHDSLAALAYWLGGDKILMTSPSWTLAGTWGANAVYSGIGIETQQNGATVTIQVTGDTFEFQQTVSDGNTGSLTVSSDGTSVATFPCSPAMTLGISGRPIFAPSWRRVTGLGSGTHTVQLKANVPNGSAVVMIDYALSATKTNGLRVILLKQPYSKQGDDANVNLMNGVVGTVVSEVQASGLNITLIDTSVQRYQLCNDLIHFCNMDQFDVADIVKKGL